MKYRFVKVLASVVLSLALLSGRTVSVSASASRNTLQPNAGTETAAEFSVSRELSYDELNYQPVTKLSGLFSTLPDKSAPGGLNLTPGLLCSGVSLYGYSLNGMHPADAKKLVSETADALLSKTVHIESTNHDHIYETTLKKLGLECETASLLNAIDEAVMPEGTIFERYRFAREQVQKSADYRLKLTGLPKVKIASMLETKLKDWNRARVDATVSFSSGVRIVTPSSDGEHYGFTNALGKLIDDFESDRILHTGDTYYLHPDEELVPAAFTTAQAETCTIIGSFTTAYPRPYDEISLNRQTNLQVSVGNMNGTVIGAGETASALTMYHDVTFANGYRPAGTIMGSVHVDAIGGGICQTTTTLYNAILNAELGIAYRNNHSMIVTYVDPSRDAMVYYEGWDHHSAKYDFLFTNTTSAPIKIEAFVNTIDCTLTVNIIGQEEHDPGRTVQYVSEILGIYAPALNCITDNNIVNSYEFGAVNYHLISGCGPQAGMTSRLWKIVYQDGVEIERSLVNANDVYKPQNATYACAPGVSLFASCNSDRATGYVTINMVH